MRHLLFRTVILCAFLSLLLFAAGFVLALSPSLWAPARQAPVSETPSSGQRQPQPSTGVLRMVSLGDSLTRGTGDVSGRGYVGIVRDKLEQEREQSVILTNLAVSGWQSEELLAQLQQEEVKRQVAEANIILFTIGGNDLFQRSGGIYELEKTRIEEAIDQLALRFEQILARLRTLNSQATIIYIALYNPFGDTEAAADTIGPVLSWNSKASEIAASFEEVIVVPTYDLFQEKEQQYLYSDHFHPNHAGYARMAERVLQAIP